MPLPSWTRRKRIGVVGLLQAGKTVLLTSLLDHLQNHIPDSFPIGSDGAEFHIVEWHSGRTIYEKHRASIAQGQWVRKSLLPEEYCFSLFSKKKSWRLTLLDMPGERLTDFSIAKCSRYEEWSEETLTALETCPEFRPCVHLYFELLDNLSTVQADDRRDAILKEYRRAMARMCVQCQPFITPSSFLINTEGQYVPNAWASAQNPIEWIAENRYSGLDSEQQFAPLPAVVRGQNEALAAEFSRHYLAYRKKLVLPFARRLRTCNELLVPVDVAMLLEGGVGTFNVQRLLLERLIEYVDPGLSYWGQGLKLLGRSGVESVTFIATKADRVHKSDRSRLISLLEELCRPIVKSRVARWGLNVKYMSCAAVEAVQCEGDGQTRLVQYHPVSRDTEASAPPQTYQCEVSQIPESWPNQWQPKDFVFPNAAPSIPANRNNPPQHIGLDRVAEAMLFRHGRAPHGVSL